MYRTTLYSESYAVGYPQEKTSTATIPTLTTLGTAVANSASIVGGAGAGSTLQVKRFIGGPGVTMVESADAITIGSAITLNSLGNAVANSAELVGDTDTGPNLRLKRLIGDANVVLTASANTVTIGSNINIAAVGVGSSLIANAVGPNFTLKRVKSASHLLQVSDNANTVTISADIRHVTMIRPQDVQATMGQCQLVSVGRIHACV